MKFRKKPVVIEAMRWTGNNSDELVAWSPSVRLNAFGALEIPTLEGMMEASKGDWIIRGVNGEFYPCKPDIFEKTYEAVE